MTRRGKGLDRDGDGWMEMMEWNEQRKMRSGESGDVKCKLCVRMYNSILGGKSEGEERGKGEGTEE